MSKIEELKKWSLLRGIALGINVPVLTTIVVGALTNSMEFETWACFMALFAGCMSVEVYANARWKRTASGILADNLVEEDKKDKED